MPSLTNATSASSILLPSRLERRLIRMAVVPPFSLTLTNMKMVAPLVSTSKISYGSDTVVTLKQVSVWFIRIASVLTTVWRI